MQVKIKKLHPDAVIPQYAHSGEDAGMDLTAVSRSFDMDKGIMTYGTGLAMEIPAGHVGLLFPRSSIYKTCNRLTNSVGVIDPGYRGEIMTKFDSGSGTDYKVGERIAQIIILPFPEVTFEEVDELEDSSRGEGGYGSSGK